MIAKSWSALVGLIAALWVSVCERTRMRLSATLIDAGAYLALDPIERRARKIRRRLRGRKGRRLGLYRALISMGATGLAGEASLVLGTRKTPSGRKQTLLCVAASSASFASSNEKQEAGPEGEPEFYWAVRTQRADAPRGLAGARTTMLSEREGALETALLAFFAETVPQRLAGLYPFDPHEPPFHLGSIPEIELPVESPVA